MPDAELTDRDGELPPNGHRLDTGRSSLLPHPEAHNEAGGTGTPGTVLDTTTAADSGLLRVAEDDDDGVVCAPSGNRWLMPNALARCGLPDSRLRSGGVGRLRLRKLEAEWGC